MSPKYAIGVDYGTESGRALLVERRLFLLRFGDAGSVAGGRFGHGFDRFGEVLRRGFARGDVRLGVGRQVPHAAHAPATLGKA